MQSKPPTLHVALPAMNERQYIEATLQCLQEQSLEGFHTWICVNQPESFRNHPEKHAICENNTQTLQLLRNLPQHNLHILDYSSAGKGWQEGKLGVGMARKTLMDAIMGFASEGDIIVSLDADTTFEKDYLASVVRTFERHPKAVALSNPYFHPLTGQQELDRAILRYEIYMRYYALNMRFTGTPYCFTPLGSAMAAPVWAVKKIGGLTPKKSGEDFYFLQKLTKTGPVIRHNSQIVYPGTRASDRVFFGTGPAVIKGLAGQWSAYPLFNMELFAQVKQTIDMFPLQFKASHPTPMDSFLSGQFRCNDIYEALRINHRSCEGFVKACHEKLDGLRILQFLKAGHAQAPDADEENLKAFLQTYYPANPLSEELKKLSFSHSELNIINKIRIFLFQTELEIQKTDANTIAKPL